jgi:hypothetical protein
MTRNTLFILGVATALTLASGPAARAGTPMRLTPVGTTSPAVCPPGSPNGFQAPEIDTSMDDESGDDIGTWVNRTIATAPGNSLSAHAGKKAKSNPELNVSFHGLDLYDQRYANGGNQFTVEPPDQGLAVGNGYVVEAVNDVFRIFDTNGNPLTDAIDLNTFYNYPAAINRTTTPLSYGPSITDPSVYYDHDTQRFFVVVLTLDRVGTTSSLSGRNHLDLAVSDTSDPTGTWTIYTLPVQNNGTDGTPDHHCAGGFCLGDYPHMGADAHGIFLTTNEFSFFGPGFYGAQIYALSKADLVTGSPVNGTAFNTSDTQYLFDLTGNGDLAPGFTVWPAISPNGIYAGGQGGTEYFLSSWAVYADTGVDDRISVWAVTGTKAIDSNPASLSLIRATVSGMPYAVPGRATQKPGDYPLGQFLGDSIGKLDANDSRMQQVSYANGKLWGAVDTGLSIDGDPTPRAGIAYFVLQPQMDGTKPKAKVVQYGLLGLSGNNLTYPAIAVTPSGRGVMAFTLVGDDYFPSAGYAGIDAIIGAGDIHVASTGLGPQDGFTEYPQYTNRPRWGDYGAAISDGPSIWIASEYIGQTCTLAEWNLDFTCGGTRAQLGNWGTRISQVTP